MLALILGTGVALSKQEAVVLGPTVDSVVNSSDGVAIHGYDPVSYLDDHEAVLGSPEFSASWGGALWWFSSAGNRARFLQEPLTYMPQYGGYEAYGVAIGKTYDVDPTVFDVVDGRVYLHRNDRVRELWQRNPAGYITEADEAWRAGDLVASP